MATKRSASSSVESGSPTSKRAKKEAELEKVQDLLAGLADTLQYYDNSKEPNTELQRLCAWGLDVNTTIGSFDPGNAILKPPSLSNPYYADFADDMYSLANEYVGLKMALAGIRLPPSQYANGAWTTDQANQSDILCMRPVERIGVPLSTLHDAFYHFQHEANMTFQQSPETIPAASAADWLCRKMGDAYEDGDDIDRTRAFNRCVNPLFPSRRWKMRVRVNPMSEKCSGTIDAAFHNDSSSVATILRQDKKEMGRDGDAYMQIARVYHMYVKTLEDRKDEPEVQAALAHGAPMFLLCVQGSVLSICGAFHDGKAVIVTPLCASPWMLRDDALQQHLSQVLYALRRGVDNIHRSLSLPAAPLVPSVPRLYTTCRKSDGAEVPITFKSVFHATLNKYIFNVELDGTRHALAKMTDRGYGTEVHQFLAEKGFAPEFLGTCTLEGRPTVYVMERLSRSWITLDDWGGCVESGDPAAIRADVRNQIMEIIGLLEQKGYVHGDLRARNIMISRDMDREGYFKLNVIDFDWAGEAGKTCYPIDRNDNIEDWPQGSKKGYPIALGHDRALVKNWWGDFIANA